MQFFGLADLPPAHDEVFVSGFQRDRRGALEQIRGHLMSARALEALEVDPVDGIPHPGQGLGGGRGGILPEPLYEEAGGKADCQRGSGRRRQDSVRCHLPEVYTWKSSLIRVPFRRFARALASMSAIVRRRNGYSIIALFAQAGA